MLKRLARALSYANVAATLALVFSMSGGALAAEHYLVNSTRQINPKVLRQLRGSAGPQGPPGLAGATGPIGPRGIKGEAGPEGKTGPEGKQDPQGVAGPEGKQGPEGKEGKRGATGERGPVGAEGKEGPPGPEGGSGGEPAALKHWRKTINVAGATKASAASIVLLEAAPFTISGRCWEEEGETLAQTDISTTQPDSFLHAYEELAEEFSGEEVLVPEAAESISSAHKPVLTGGPEGGFSATSADGTVALDGMADQGVWLQGGEGPACSFYGYAVAE
jgi:hypothetical protein